MAEPSLPRGFRDYGPDEYELLEGIREAFVEEARLFGFRLVEPSTVELLPILEAKSGPAIRDEIYHFVDKGGRGVGLRFDLTVGLARYYCSDRSLPKGTRLASFGDVWRYDEPQRGRYRWFYQWDVEIFGPTSYLADLEVVSFAHGLLRRLGISGARFIVNDRGLTEGMMEEVARAMGVPLGPEAKLDLLRALDKLEKRGREAVVEEYGQRYGRELVGEVVDRATSAPERLTERLGRIVEGMEALGIPFEVSPSLARGLDYYTSFVFEVKDSSTPEVGSIVGGGRYDALLEAFGKPGHGATGAAGGVDRIAEAIRRRGGAQPRAPAVAVIYSPGSEAHALRALEELRSAGIPAVMPIYDKVPHIQRMFLDARDYGAIVIAGEREASSGVYRVKVKGGEEVEARPGDLASLILGRSR